MELNIFIVFFAGMGTFLYPCIIPLVPSYLSYISGVAIGEESDSKGKFKVMMHTLFFILGFGSAFSALQILVSKFTNLASGLLGNNILYGILGGMVILMGLNMTGLFKIKKLYSEKRFNFSFIRKNLFTSYFFGFAFGFGWTPCMGPVLFYVMSYIAGADTMIQGIFYIWIYTFGLGFPFMVFAFLMDKKRTMNFIKEHFLLTEKAGGVILIIMGIILAANRMDIFLSWGFRDEIFGFIKGLIGK